ncbi:exopolyphosphatase [soil metagenome]
MNLSSTSLAINQLPSSRWPGHLAAIDMGSNSFRLEIATVQHDRYKRVEYLKETVRLGAGLDDNGHLTEEAVKRALACLQRFAERLEGYASWQVRAVATQTLREARNRDAFLARAQAVLGHTIEVISGREEARLIFAGVARLQPSDLPRLVIDIGGRSTEMIIGRARVPSQAESFQVGSVGLSMKYFGDGRFTESAFQAAQVEAGAQLEEALELFAPRHWQEALGSSGTAGAVSQILAASNITDGHITPEALRWCIEKCLQAGTVSNLSLPGLRDDRRAVIGGGLSILYTLATHYGIAALRPARGALRQGVIFELYDRLHVAEPGYQAKDVREESVRMLQSRFQVDMQQAGRVVSAIDVLNNGGKSRGADGRTDGRADGRTREYLDDQTEALRWAGALHELGMMVSHHDHHRHSAYVIAHADAPGFSQSQQRRLADLVLGQRGGLRKLEAQLVDPAFAWQVLCLRLAIIFCHARSEVDMQGIRLKLSGTKATLELPQQWAATHPRTLHWLEEEIVTWERNGPLKFSLRKS